jgi:hypothetical protein
MCSQLVDRSVRYLCTEVFHSPQTVQAGEDEPTGGTGNLVNWSPYSASMRADNIPYGHVVFTEEAYNKRRRIDQIRMITMTPKR